MTKLLFWFSAALLFAISACGDDDSPADGSAEDATVDAPTADASDDATVDASEDAAEEDASDAASDATPDATADASGDATPDANARGCANNPNLCEGRLMCCSGVPYPPEGICMLECNMRSDRDAKRDFRPVDEHQILERLANLEVTEWSYHEQPGTRHVGPMAQDFHAAFGLGQSDRQIHSVDANGITIAAIQALTERVERLEAQNQVLTSQNRELLEANRALLGANRELAESTTPAE